MESIKSKAVPVGLLSRINPITSDALIFNVRSRSKQSTGFQTVVIEFFLIPKIDHNYEYNHLLGMA